MPVSATGWSCNSDRQAEATQRATCAVWFNEAGVDDVGAAVDGLERERRWTANCADSVDACDGGPASKLSKLFPKAQLVHAFRVKGALLVMPGPRFANKLFDKFALWLWDHQLGPSCTSHVHPKPH
ncbi:hypothetical protein E4U55_004907 [Claviceps digitariae]|nr:hypothetical protein E4U55_004907 [Claviceps digitariae]